MVTLKDVLHHIAQELPHYSGSDNPEDIRAFVLANVAALHLRITKDIEETELQYLERHGKGLTYYFRLKNVEHGVLLSAQLCDVFDFARPDFDQEDAELYAPDDMLFLFIHINTTFPIQPRLSISV